MTAVSFEYVAVTRGGQTQRGSTHAPSPTEAYRQLAAQGLIPLSIRASARAGGLMGPRTGKRLHARDVAEFTAQLAVLLHARVPVGQALAGLAEQEGDPRLTDIARDVARRIECGDALAEALARHPEAFDAVYVESVRAGEKSGSLIQVLEVLAEGLERAEETGRQVRGALAYPLCVLLVLAVGITFLVGYVVPKFAAMFAARGVELPLLTRLLALAGAHVQQWWFLYLPVIVGSVLLLRAAWRSTHSPWRARLEAALHLFGPLRSILTGLAVGRFLRVLGMTLGAGLGLIESLELAGRASGRPRLQADVDKLVRQVRAGGRLGEVLTGCTYIPPIARRMLTAGETAGELPKMAAAAARHFDRQTQHLAKTLATVLEPLLIVVLTVMVLIIALAIFLPMWDMVKLVG